ncbi:MAG: hypothetical protein JO115_18030 [Pseudonocardiales bacterium]|nr:hypothetical protein [Pseudonocardiales bacterium]
MGWDTAGLTALRTLANPAVIWFRPAHLGSQSARRPGTGTVASFFVIAGGDWLTIAVGRAHWEVMAGPPPGCCGDVAARKVRTARLGDYRVQARQEVDQ